MKLSTGKVAFPIEFDNGEKEVIYFNPNDRDFINRVRGFENSISERTKKIDIEKYKARIGNGINAELDYETLKNMSAEEMNVLCDQFSVVMDIDAEYQQALKDELNDIFKSDVSSVVFKYCEPTDMVIVTDEKGNEKSEMFLLQFINAFAEEIKKYQAKVTPAMEKHVGKYR